MKTVLFLCLLMVKVTTQTDLSNDLASDPQDNIYEYDLYCEPDCIGKDPGVLTPDPRNCHRYYTCLEDEMASDVVFSCPEEEKFDAVTLECSPDYRNITCGTCEPACAFDCPYGEIMFVASRFNCSEYILCGMGDQEPIECPSEQPFFDGVECQTDEDLCCDPCVVFCKSAFTEIADPTDCRAFYYCSEDGYFPSDADRYLCPDGEIFHKGRCVEDDGTVECEEPCVEV